MNIYIVSYGLTPECGNPTVIAAKREEEAHQIARDQPRPYGPWYFLAPRLAHSGDLGTIASQAIHCSGEPRYLDAKQRVGLISEKFPNWKPETSPKSGDTGVKKDG